MPDSFSFAPGWLKDTINSIAPPLPPVLAPYGDPAGQLAAYGSAQLGQAPDLSGVTAQLNSLANPPAPDSPGLSLTPWQSGAASGSSLIGSQAPAAPYAWSSDNGQNVYIQRPYGDLEVRNGGTLTWRNNNPGNVITDPSQIGQNQSTHGRHFAIFDSPDAGDAAQQNLLFGPKYADMTIADAITHYAPGTENNTPAYIAFVTRQTGFSPDTVLNALNDQQRSDFTGAIRRYEGLTPGTANTYIYNPFEN